MVCFTLKTPLTGRMGVTMDEKVYTTEEKERENTLPSDIRYAYFGSRVEIDGTGYPVIGGSGVGTGVGTGVSIGSPPKMVLQSSAKHRNASIYMLLLSSGWISSLI